MSTIASPRASISVRSPSSSRTSLDTTASSRALPSAAPSNRRNRAALRDYYGLKGAGANAAESNGANIRSNSTSEERPHDESEELSELDREGFDADAYVSELLGREGLEGVLKAESKLLSGWCWCDMELLVVG